MLVLTLADCTHFELTAPERDLRVRERRYNAALRTLAPGSTRTDLERLFPGARPRYVNAEYASFTGAFTTSLFPLEQHPVDADFVILVNYDYLHRRWESQSGSTRAKNLHAKTRPARQGTSTADIDAMLAGLMTVRACPVGGDRILQMPLRVARRQSSGLPIAH